MFYHPQLSPADKILYPYLNKASRLCDVYEVSYRNLAEMSGLHQLTLSKSLFRYAEAGFIEVIGTTKGRKGGIAYRIKKLVRDVGKNRRPIDYVKQKKRGNRPLYVMLSELDLVFLRSEMKKDPYSSAHEIIRHKWLKK